MVTSATVRAVASVRTADQNATHVKERVANAARRKSQKLRAVSRQTLSRRQKLRVVSRDTATRVDRLETLTRNLT